MAFSFAFLAGLVAHACSDLQENAGTILVQKL